MNSRLHFIAFFAVPVKNSSLSGWCSPTKCNHIWMKWQQPRKVVLKWNFNYGFAFTFQCTWNVDSCLKFKKTVNLKFSLKKKTINFHTLNKFLRARINFHLWKNVLIKFVHFTTLKWMQWAWYWLMTLTSQSNFAMINDSHENKHAIKSRRDTHRWNVSENRLKYLLVSIQIKLRHKAANNLIWRSSMLFSSFTKLLSARISVLPVFNSPKKATKIKHWFWMDLLAFLLHNVPSDIHRVRTISDKTGPNSLITLGFSCKSVLQFKLS